MQVTLFNDNIVEGKPFMKWLGGKRQLIPEIEKRLPEHIKISKKIDSYFEPFIGGGALFFYLMSNYHIKKAYISDINKELILIYNAIKNDDKKVITYLKEMESEFLKLDNDKRKAYYLNVREEFNNQLKTYDFKNYSEETIKRAVKSMLMNKTGFNGLFRLNKKGEFNVPFGRYKNPKICDETNIHNVHKILKNVTIKNKPYDYSEKYIEKGSLVYLDPPYRPISKTSSFTSYSDNEFNDEHQIELAHYYERISNKGAYALLCNSDPHNNDPNDDFFDLLYSKYCIDRIPAKRSINSKGNKRGPVNELLIKNY